jgi:hypothetical protein
LLALPTAGSVRRPALADGLPGPFLILKAVGMDNRQAGSRRWAMVSPWLAALTLVGALVLTGGAVDGSHLFRATKPEEVAEKLTPGGKMTQLFAIAIYRRVATDRDARAMTAIDAGSVYPIDRQRVVASHHRFLTESVRLGVDKKVAEDGFWLATWIYRPLGSDPILRAMMKQEDPSWFSPPPGQANER